MTNEKVKCNKCNFIDDKITEALEDDYFESWNDLEIEQVKKQEVA
jgi:hypothetical protein